MTPEEIGEGCILPNMIPVSQLYGMKGLVTNTPEYQKKIKNREGGWDHNFVAAQSLKQPINSKESMMHSVNSNSHQQGSSINGTNKLQMPSRSLSPVARRNSNNNISSGGDIFILISISNFHLITQAISILIPYSKCSHHRIAI